MATNFKKKSYEPVRVFKHSFLRRVFGKDLVELKFFQPSPVHFDLNRVVIRSLYRVLVLIRFLCRTQRTYATIDPYFT